MSNESNTQDNGGQNESGQAGADEAGQNAGFQKRIDELTAARYKAQAEAEAAQKMQERLLAQLQAVQAQQVQPQAVADPLSELDPALAKALQAVTSKFETQIGTLKQQLVAQSQATEIQQVAAARGVTDDAIRQRAVVLAQQLSAKGIPLNAEDALRFAIGESVMNGNQAPRDPLGRFQGAQISGQAPRQQTPPTGPKALPNNFERLSPTQQEKLLADRGVDDLPF